jgi:hypothetical protein
MSAHLLSTPRELIVAILAVLTTASASVAKKWLEETFRTRRMVRSIEDSAPDQRPDIIRAIAQLEGRSASEHPEEHTTTRHPSPWRGVAMIEMANHVDILKNPLIRHLIALNLDRDDFVVFGSAPLLAHGLRRSIGDLDIVARGAAWRRACELGVPAIGTISGDPIVSLCGGFIQVSQEWVPRSRSADDLIGRAEIIQGLRFAQLADVLAYKQMLMRPKDIADIQALSQISIGLWRGLH